MRGTLLVNNIRYLVSCDDQDHIWQHVQMLVEGNRITGIRQMGEETEDPWEADEVLDGTDKVLYPGLINTHHHLYQTFTRNLPKVQNMELFPWLRYLYEIWKELDEEMIYYSALTGIGELLKTGCTTCMDHHYVFPEKAGDRLIDAQFRAAADLGIRFVASRGSMDLSVKDGGLPPDTVVQSIDQIMDDSQRLVETYQDDSFGSMRQVVLAPCSPFSVSEELLRETAQLARHLHVRLHTHLAETKNEEKYTLERYGMRPLAYMESLGWTGEDVWFAHGIHFNEQELDFLAETGTGVAHCPISNMKLASGVARIPEMLKKGVPVGLAVDGSASNDGSSLLEEMRVAYLLHRLHSSAQAPSGYDILKMATRGSAKILGRTDIGNLQIGKVADFFMIDLCRIPLIGTMFDPASLLGTVGYKGNVDDTVVNGKVVVKKGRLTRLAEEQIVEQAGKQVERLHQTR